MPQQQTGSFDFSALNTAPSSSTSAAPAFDFSATPYATPAPAQPSMLQRVTDAALTPLVSQERARQLVGSQGALPDVSILGTFLDAVRSIPHLLVGQPPSPSVIANNPLIQAGGDVLQNAVTQPSTIPAIVKGAAQGVTEGAAQLTDPVDLAMILAGGGSRAVRPAFVRALRALPEAERALIAMRASGNLPEIKQIIGEIQALRSQAEMSRALLSLVRGVDVGTGGAVALHGAARLADAQSLPEAGAGLAELGFGALGMKTAARVPEVGPREGLHVGELLAARGYAVTPSGAAVPAGQPVPDTVVPDASFVRAVPAQYAQRDVRGYLPEGARQVTPDGVVVPPGTPTAAMPFVDASFVRGVPAEYARREPAGLLPESAAAASEFMMLPDGTVVRRGDLPSLSGTSTLPSSAPVTGEPAPAGAGATPAAQAGKGKRTRVQEAASRLAAIMDRDASGAPIYSSDPHAQSIVGIPLSDAERPEVRRMLAEMEALGFTKHSFIDPGVGKGGDLQVIGGAGGAPVYQDILSLHGRGNPSRAEIIDALQKVLSGEKTVYGPAIREVARERLSGHRAAMLPPEAGDLRQSGQQTEQDFTEFDRYANRLAGEDAFQRYWQDVPREPGEEGRINPVVAQHLGGAVAGGLAGAASGNTPEERIKRGAVGAVVGGMLPSLIGRGGARIPAAVGTLAERTAAAGMTPDTIDARVGVGQAPLSTERPAVPNAQDAVYARVLRQGGRATGPVPADVVPLPTTARAPAAPREPMRDPLAGVDTFIQHFPEELQNGIRDIIQSNQGFQAQRRGSLSEDRTAQLAEGVSVDLSRRLKAGTAVNAESVRAFTDNLAAAQQKINTLSERVTSGHATDAEVLGLEQARAEAATLAASIMGARSEAGRALAQFKVLARVLDTGNRSLIQQTANGLRGEAAQFAERFAQLPDDPLARYRWLQTQDRPSVMDRVRSYYYSNILSGVKTHERNILGNVSNALANIAAQPVAAGVDALRSAVTGKPRTVLFSELPHQAAGALAGLQRGIDEAFFSLRHGVTRAQLSGSVSAAEAGKLDVPRVEFSGGGANPFNWPMRALDSADQFFRATARQSELYGLAFQRAKSEGLSGQALTDRMAQLVSGTDETATALQQRADVYARKAVFQEPGGNFVKGLQMLSRQYPPFSFVVPFIKTPAAIFRQGAEFSPAGFLMRGARAGGREGAQQLAKASLGSIGVGVLAYLAAQGKISGSGPSSPAARAQLMESGWRPDSVKIGDKWVNYSLFQPVSVPASIVANAFDAWRDSGAKSDASTLDRVYAGVMRSVRSGLNQSFLSGLADLVDAVESSETALGAAQKYAGRTASSFIPFVGALRTAQQATDATVRQPRTLKESVKAGLPGASQSVPGRLDRFGAEVTREGGPARRALDPFNTSTEVNDPVLQLIDRTGITVGAPSGQFKIPGAPPGTKLPDDEQRALKIAVGQAHRAALERLLQQPGFEDRPVEVQARYAEKVLRSATERVTNVARGLVRRRQPITPSLLSPAMRQH